MVRRVCCAASLMDSCVPLMLVMVGAVIGSAVFPVCSSSACAATATRSILLLRWYRIFNEHPAVGAIWRELHLVAMTVPFRLLP